MSTSNELRIFISSTFRDLQEEREHLVKKIFPEIRALCRARGVTFTDIDLRWGITEEEAEIEGIIRICLDEIDRCRPYFIGILGERYGWSPPRVDAERVADKFPILTDAMMVGTSITEMEIVHGVLANPAMAGHAFFYFRDHDATPEEFIDTDPDIARRLQDLKDRIRQSGFPVRENFANSAELGAWIEEDLRRVIDAEHPASEAPSVLELERRAHQAFATSRRRAYIANPKYAERFGEWLTIPPSTDPPQDPLPLVVVAASGLGKSSLIAHLVAEYRANHPTAFIIEHYVGASQTSGSATSVMRHIVEEIRERFGIADEAPVKPEDLEKSFPNWLFRAEHFANELGIEILVVIDAVNQLDKRGRRLTWLPRRIPQGVRLLVSTTPGECAERLAERSWSTLEVMPIDDEHTREQIVYRYLGEFHKSITREQMHRLTSDAKASVPLYLRVVSEELRLHGEHETLDTAIDTYVSAVDLLDVFDRVLARFESDYGVATVERLMSLLWASRSGLSEVELIDLAGLNRIELSRLLFAIDYHFLKRDGLLGFFHDYLRRAVEKRYLGDMALRDQLREEIAHFFEGVVLSERTALELLWQYGSQGEPQGAAERDERLASTLARLDVLMLLYRGETRFEMLEYWTQLDKRGYNPEPYYRRSLMVDTQASQTHRAEVLRSAADLLESLSQWDVAAELYGDLVTWSREHGQPAEEVHGYLGLGNIMGLHGDNAGAMEQYEAALQLASELGNLSGMSSAIGNIGVVHSAQGRFDEAMECYNRRLAICDEIGDRRGMSVTYGNMGIVHSTQGRYDEAMQCFERQLAISEENGDRSGMSLPIGNMGVVHSEQGLYRESMEYYSRWFAICEELGDRYGMSMAIGNMGIVHDSCGDYDRALECMQRQLNISTELGDRNGMSMANANMGFVYATQGRYDEAMECNNRTLAISQESGDRRGISIAINNIGSVHNELGRYDHALECYAQATEESRSIGFRYGLTDALARTTVTLLTLLAEPSDAMPEYLPTYVPGATRETWQTMSLQHARKCAEECVTVSTELSKPDTMLSGRILLMRVEAAEGHLDVALETLETMLADATDQTQQAELHYWLWKLGAPNHVTAALTLYQTLYAAAPQYAYNKRIHELTAAEEPS